MKRDDIEVLLTCLEFAVTKNYEITLFGKRYVPKEEIND